MRFVSLLDVHIDGELKMRAAQNFSRLHKDEYQLNKLFRDVEYEWPADFEGRALLALTLLGQALNSPSKNADFIIQKLPQHLNELGYMGPVSPEGICDEQTLSGHGWLLRGLFEYYLWNGNNLAKDMAETIVNKLFLPLSGHYKKYPLDANLRSGGGEAVGSRQNIIDNWRLSTDVGCAFIPLDGLSQAYTIMPTNALRMLLIEIISRFVSADKKVLGMQTHATLTALRGILRFYEATKQTEYLDIVKDTFEIYIQEALTENSENYNWFGRPDWTEPCAVVDSFMLSVGLWNHTRETAYLALAQDIYYNGLGYEQRPNGGFGCNTCSGAHNTRVSPMKDLFEAWWCCSMRGGEGLSRAAEYIWCFRNFKDKGEPSPVAEISLLFYFSNTVTLELNAGKLVLQLRTQYPFDGQFDIAVLESQVDRTVRLQFFMPDWVGDDEIALTCNREAVPGSMNSGFYQTSLVLHTGDKLLLSFPVRLNAKPTRNPHSISGHQVLRHGPLLLGVRLPQLPITEIDINRLAYFGHGVYRDKSAGLTFSPINDIVNLETSEAQDDQRQILFPVKKQANVIS